MQPMLSRVAGVDIGKEELAITVLIEEDGQTIKHQFECKTFTDDLIRTGQKLLDLGVKHVAMESTGVYWKPIWNVWKPLGLIITLGNAAHLKNVPGRKTDIKDSEWIATLHRNGLIRASYVPEREYQELRLLTRHRQNLVEDASRLKNRVQKILEDGNIKLSSVISDVFGVSGRKIVRGDFSRNDRQEYSGLSGKNQSQTERGSPQGPLQYADTSAVSSRSSAPLSIRRHSKTRSGGGRRNPFLFGEAFSSHGETG